MILLQLAFATFYITFVMVEADITTLPRLWLASKSDFLLALLSCEKCVAWWAAIFCWALYLINPILIDPLAAAGVILLLWPLWKGLLKYADS